MYEGAGASRHRMMSATAMASGARSKLRHARTLSGSGGLSCRVDMTCGVWKSRVRRCVVLEGDMQWLTSSHACQHYHRSTLWLPPPQRVFTGGLPLLALGATKAAGAVEVSTRASREGGVVAARGAVGAGGAGEGWRASGEWR